MPRSALASAGHHGPCPELAGLIHTGESLLHVDMTWVLDRLKGLQAMR